MAMTTQAPRIRCHRRTATSDLRISSPNITGEIDPPQSGPFNTDELLRQDFKPMPWLRMLGNKSFSCVFSRVTTQWRCQAQWLSLYCGDRASTRCSSATIANAYCTGNGSRCTRPYSEPAMVGHVESGRAIALARLMRSGS